MNFFSKLVVIGLVVLAIMYFKDNFVDNSKNLFLKSKIEESLLSNKFINDDVDERKPQEKNEVFLYFTNAKNGNLKKVTRVLPQSQDKIVFVMKELIKGPNHIESNQGYSSEIPKGTRVLGIKDQGGIIVLDLSNEFQYGGGTESLYTRVEQLVKTIVDLNIEKPVYLYINGQKAEVIGGEGVIINQPLSENSLDG